MDFAHCQICYLQVFFNEILSFGFLTQLYVIVICIFNEFTSVDNVIESTPEHYFGREKTSDPGFQGSGNLVTRKTSGDRTLVWTN